MKHVSAIILGYLLIHGLFEIGKEVESSVLTAGEYLFFSSVLVGLWVLGYLSGREE